MATANKTEFLNQSEIKSNDFEHKRKISAAVGNYDQAVPKAKKQFANIETARKLAKNKKWHAIEQLDEKLLAFEKNFSAKGGKVLWASSIADAQHAILEICKKHACQTVVKSKSMVTEEIQLNQFLATHNIKSIETDLGEYIQQLAHEAPYHIVTPAMHKSKEDIAKLFYEKLNAEAQLSPEELTLISRKNLRDKYTQAQIGITGGNFLVADVGGVCLTENEGNARLCTAFPPVHIALVGIEKMISSIDDLNLFWPLLATYGTGQKTAVYNTIFTGPKQPNEVDGPEAMYVILLDNGRSNLIADPTLRESAYCIRCGACLNACPVFKNIGGHAYNTTYSGPIGAVISPHLEHENEKNHLSHASTLCGSCSTACPVGIDIHGLLQHNRTLDKTNGAIEEEEYNIWSKWSKAMQKKGLAGLNKSSIKKSMLHAFFTKEDRPQPPAKTFKKLYKESKKKK